VEMVCAEIPASCELSDMFCELIGRVLGPVESGFKEVQSERRQGTCFRAHAERQAGTPLMVSRHSIPCGGTWPWNADIPAWRALKPPEAT
jgi:hypothetical protein